MHIMQGWSKTKKNRWCRWVFKRKAHE